MVHYMENTKDEVSASQPLRPQCQVPNQTSDKTKHTQGPRSLSNYQFDLPALPAELRYQIYDTILAEGRTVTLYANRGEPAYIDKVFSWRPSFTVTTRSSNNIPSLLHTSKEMRSYAAAHYTWLTWRFQHLQTITRGGGFCFNFQYDTLRFADPETVETVFNMMSSPRLYRMAGIHKYHSCKDYDDCHKPILPGVPDADGLDVWAPMIRRVVVGDEFEGGYSYSDLGRLLLAFTGLEAITLPLAPDLYTRGMGTQKLEAKRSCEIFLMEWRDGVRKLWFDRSGRMKYDKETPVPEHPELVVIPALAYLEEKSSERQL